MSFQSLLAAMLFSVLILVAPRTFAKGYGGGSGARGNGGGTTPTDSPPTVDHSASIKARQDVTAANVEVNKANQLVERITLRLLMDFRQTAVWQKIKSDSEAARSDLDATRTQVLRDLANHSDYRAATTLKQKTEAERNAMPPDASPEDRTRITRTLLEVDQHLLDFEQVALAANAAWRGAQSKFTEARDKSVQLLKTFEGSLKDNAECQTANAASGEKKLALVSAQKALTAAIAQEAQAKR